MPTSFFSQNNDFLKRKDGLTLRSIFWILVLHSGFVSLSQCFTCSVPNSSCKPDIRSEVCLGCTEINFFSAVPGLIGHTRSSVVQDLQLWHTNSQLQQAGSSSPTRDGTHALWLGSLEFSQWTTREVPGDIFDKSYSQVLQYINIQNINKTPMNI